MLKRANMEFYERTRNASFALLYKDAYDLHKYFYGGRGDTDEENDTFVRVKNELGKLINQYIK